MTNKAIQLDKYGLPVNTKVTEKDRNLIHQIFRMVEAKKQEAQKKGWPRNPDGSVWCESC
jgi:hypothetical protein